MAYQQTIWADLRQRLADRYDGVPFWTDAEALLAVNEGLLVWNLCTGRWKRRDTSLVTVAGQLLYTAPAILLWRTRIAVNGYPLSPSNREDLNHGRFRWRTDTTSSGGGVPTRPTVWAPVSLRTFYLWPADAAGGAPITLDGVAATPVLVTDADYLDLGEEHTAALLGYALHVLTFTKGGPAFAATTPLFTTFLAAAAEENDQLAASSVYRRLMGLDLARTLKLYRGGPTSLDQVAAGVGPRRSSGGGAA